MKLKTLTILFFFVSTFSLLAQQKEEQIIKDLKFDTGKVYLNTKHAFNYLKDGNHFAILDLENKEIITCDITSLGEGKFSSIINFVEQNKKFSNSKIIGRNDLFFRMLENNVITADFKIDPIKLNVFFEKYNELK